MGLNKWHPLVHLTDVTARLASPQARAVLIMTHFHTCNNQVGMPDCVTYAFNLNSVSLTTLKRLTLLYGG